MERVIVKDLKRDMKTHKEKVLQSHRVKRRLDTIQAAAAKLVGWLEACWACDGLVYVSDALLGLTTHPLQVKIYEDDDGARKEEIAALANKENPFQAFYDRLKDVREYHRRFPNMDVTEVLLWVWWDSLGTPMWTR
jgi:splicing factor 3A subunit 3